MVQGFIDIRHLAIPSPDHLGIFTSRLATRGSHGKSDSFTSDQSPKSGSKKSTIAEPVSVDIRSYTFVDKVGESAIAREYTPVIDGYLDDELDQVVECIAEGAVDNQESNDIGTGMHVDTQSSVTYTSSDDMMNNIEPGDQARAVDSERTIAGSRSPSPSTTSSDVSATQFLTETATNLQARRREKPEEHSLTVSDVPSPHMTAAASYSMHSTDSYNTDNVDDLYSSGPFQPDMERTLELRELAADGSCEEAGKQDREETPTPPQEDLTSERKGVELPTITMALISRRSRHRAGGMGMVSVPAWLACG